MSNYGTQVKQLGKYQIYTKTQELKIISLGHVKVNFQKIHFFSL